MWCCLRCLFPQGRAMPKSITSRSAAADEDVCGFSPNAPRRVCAHRPALRRSARRASICVRVPVRSPDPQPRLERLAFEQLHGHVGVRAVVVEVEHFHDISCARLCARSVSAAGHRGVRMPPECVAQQFQRDVGLRARKSSLLRSRALNTFPFLPDRVPSRACSAVEDVSHLGGRLGVSCHCFSGRANVGGWTRLIPVAVAGSMDRRVEMGSKRPAREPTAQVEPGLLGSIWLYRRATETDAR